MMNKNITLVFSLLLINCAQRKYSNSEIETVKNELQKIYEIDQLCAKNAAPPEKLKHFSDIKWQSYKDSIYAINRKKAEKIINKYGYLGIDKVGENDSNILWIIAQHSDKNVKFQKKILNKLKIEVDKKNVNPKNYAYLYDRIKVNCNKKQLYATQVEYNKKGQATPKKLRDSLNIDARRAQYKLPPLKEYLNDLTEMHFEMNKENYRKKGIIKPIFYK